jgi:hypothetical protein
VHPSVIQPVLMGSADHLALSCIVQIWDLIVVGAGVAGSALAYKQGKVSSAASWTVFLPAHQQLLLCAAHEQ